MAILEPSKATLKKYGLSIEEWRAILEKQNGVCFVCKKVPEKNKLAIDHEHVLRWKKMPPEKRKLYVRGLLCFFCNFRLVARGMTLEKAKNVVEYLQNYQNFKNDNTIK